MACETHGEGCRTHRLRRSDIEFQGFLLASARLDVPGAPVLVDLYRGCEGAYFLATLRAGEDEAYDAAPFADAGTVVASLSAQGDIMEPQDGGATRRGYAELLSEAAKADVDIAEALGEGGL